MLLGVVGCQSIEDGGIEMRNHSKLDRLAHSLKAWLLVLFLALKSANAFLELLSKAVNYNARKIPKLRLLLQA